MLACAACGERAAGSASTIPSHALTMPEPTRAAACCRGFLHPELFATRRRCAGVPRALPE